jgi:hypothetical protein
VAFESNVALGGGSDIKQHSREIFILVGAGLGFVLGGDFGRSGSPGEPSKLNSTKINEAL